MRCTGKERNTCNEERLGCSGCYWDGKPTEILDAIQDLIKYNEYTKAKLGTPDKNTELILRYINELENRIADLENKS